MIAKTICHVWDPVTSSYVLEHDNSRQVVRISTWSESRCVYVLYRDSICDAHDGWIFFRDAFSKTCDDTDDKRGWRHLYDRDEMIKYSRKLITTLTTSVSDKQSITQSSSRVVNNRFRVSQVASPITLGQGTDSDSLICIQSPNVPYLMFPFQLSIPFRTSTPSVDRARHSESNRVHRIVG